MARRSRKRSRVSRTFRLLGAGALVIIAFAYVSPLRAYLDARRQVAERKAELAVLERDQARLERRLAASDTDQFVEQEARRLGLVRPGERLFIVRGLETVRGARLR
jgi:cell division protein FtsB